jgi:hypothetical protein
MCNCMAFHLYEFSYAVQVGGRVQTICHKVGNCMVFHLYELSYVCQAYFSCQKFYYTVDSLTT